MPIPRNFISPERRLLAELYGKTGQHCALSLEERYLTELRRKPAQHWVALAYEEE